jgi:hypothetical protein
MASAGGVFRRCARADPVTGRQLGGSCPRLADDGHGSWYIQLELPAALDGGRRRIRRGGYPSSDTAEAVLAGLRMPAPGDPHADVLTVAPDLWGSITRCSSITKPTCGRFCGPTPGTITGTVRTSPGSSGHPIMTSRSSYRWTRRCTAGRSSAA